MKILFVVEHFYPYVGGAEELFLNLTVSLAKAGFEINVITTLHDNSLKNYEEHHGVKITRINCHNRFLFTLMSLPAIMHIGRKSDFIHTTSYNSAIPSFIGGLLLRKKVLITFHEVWGKLWFRLPFTSKWKLTSYYIYEWFILKLPFYKYIAVSDFTKNSLIENGIDENKIVQIYNGVNYELLSGFNHRPPENFTFCFFGRMGISKGIELLLGATKLFIKKHPGTILKLIIPLYPDALFRKVMESISFYQLEKNIILFHNLTKEKLFHEVSTSSCVVIPSYSEGFCFVAVESTGMGIPVISSGKGALAEVISGKHLTLDQLNAQSIFHALEKAFLNEWDYSSPLIFPLKTSVEKYINLYLQLGKREK